MSDLLKELFRGVVWPRDPSTDASGKSVYRYAIVGMLVTNTRIEGLDPNETVLDGVMIRYSAEMGMTVAIERSGKHHPAFATGDATSVLLSLDDIVGPRMKPKRANK